MTNMSDIARARRLVALNNLGTPRRQRPGYAKAALARVFRSQRIFGLGFA